MKKIVLLVLSCFVITSFSLTIKMGSLAPQNSPWDDALKKLQSEWSTASNGTATR